MHTELVENFKNKVCTTCNERKVCRQKPHKIMKCGVMWLVKNG